MSDEFTEEVERLEQYSTENLLKMLSDPDKSDDYNYETTPFVVIMDRQQKQIEALQRRMNKMMDDATRPGGMLPHFRHKN